MADQEHVTSRRASPSRSDTTRWSTVLAARGRDTPEAREALADLCGTYWYPVYAFVRSKGHGPDEAEDLVQGFFARLVEGDRLAGVDPGKGTLRAFLLAACTNYLSDRRDHDRALKRGGGRAPVSIDWRDADARYGAEPSHALTAERLFDRRWALTLLHRADDRLRAEMGRDDKAELYDRLKSAMMGERGAARYAAIARDLGKTEGAVKMAAVRLRARFGQLLREEIAATVPGRDGIDDEVAELFNALGG
jgi:RNA polymerase sigma-70 factor (ECF subfamily)